MSRQIYTDIERDKALKLLGGAKVVSPSILKEIRSQLNAPNLSGSTVQRWLYQSNPCEEQVNLVFNPEALLMDLPSLEGFWREDEIAALQEAADVDSMIDGAVDGEQPEGDRLTSQRQKQIKPVLYVVDLAIFERALASTGLVNRGEALLEVCRVYLEGKA